MCSISQTEVGSEGREGGGAIIGICVICGELMMNDTLITISKHRSLTSLSFLSWWCSS
jgi:hypothetical protein